MEIQTKRLVLRPITMADKASVAYNANDKELADNTLNIPFPYTEDDAEWWINKLQEPSDNVVFGITIDDKVVGAIGLHKIIEGHMAEIGYWLGRDYWNKGYMTEALEAVIKYGFEELDLIRQYANVFVNNKGSAKVLEKCGFKFEGILRKAAKKLDGTVRDEAMYSLLKEEYK